MKLETKTSMLLYNVISKRVDYDIEIYDLIQKSGALDKYIEEVNEESLYYNNVYTENGINARYFLRCLTLIVRTMKQSFFNAYSLHNCMIETLRTADKELQSLFNYKAPLELDNSPRVDEIILNKIYKIIIRNFIANAKYVACIEKILNENNIDLKDVEQYSYAESSKILSIMSDIAFCFRGRITIIELFSDIEYHLKAKLKIKEKGRKTHPVEYYRDQYIDKYNKKYETMINSYNNKKKYLKYFT